MNSKIKEINKKMKFNGEFLIKNYFINKLKFQKLNCFLLKKIRTKLRVL